MSIALPGYVPDQVAVTGHPTADWANAIRDRAVQVFDTGADLIALFDGSPAPQVGQVACISTGASAGLLQYVGTTDGWTKPWNATWGVIGFGQVTANQGPIIGLTDLTGLSCTVTLLANRQYQIYVDLSMLSGLGNSNVTVYLTDGAGTVLKSQTQAGPGPNAFLPFCFSRYTSIPATAGSYTWKVQAVRTGSDTLTLEASTDSPAQIIVNDMGPIGAPA